MSSPGERFEFVRQSPDWVEAESVAQAKKFVDELPLHLGVQGDKKDIYDGLADLVSIAVDNKDVTALLSYAEKVAEYPYHDAAVLAGIRYEASVLDNEESITALHESLREEQIGNLMDNMKIKHHDANSSVRRLPSPALETVIRKAAARGMPPKNWIDMYCADSGQELDLQLSYCESYMPSSIADPTLLSKSRDRANELLLEADDALAYIAFTNCARAMAIQNNTEAQMAVARKFIDIAYAPHTLRKTPEIIKTLFAMADQMLLFAEPEYPLHIKWFESYIDRNVDVFTKDANGIDEVCSSAITWKTKLAQWQGKSDEYVVTEVDEECASLMNSIHVVLLGNKREASLNNIIKVRDIVFGRQAIASAENQEFSKAFFFVSRCSPNLRQKITLMHCLEHAKTPQHIEDLAPVIKLDIYDDPELSAIFEVAQMVVEGDSAALCDKAKHIASELGEVKDKKITPVSFALVKTLLTKAFAVDHIEATNTTSIIIEQLKNNAGHHKEISWLRTQLLEKTGDTGQYFDMFHDIARDPNKTNQFRRYASLAKMIRQDQA